VTIPCTRCHRRFGGHETWSRHFDRRQDRCRGDRELRARGMVQDPAGVWRRVVTVKAPAQAALFDRRTAARRKRRLHVQDGQAAFPGTQELPTHERAREVRQKTTEGHAA
jgi:hypothetical protein